MLSFSQSTLLILKADGKSSLNVLSKVFLKRNLRKNLHQKPHHPVYQAPEEYQN